MHESTFLSHEASCQIEVPDARCARSERRRDETRISTPCVQACGISAGENATDYMEGRQHETSSASLACGPKILCAGARTHAGLCLDMFRDFCRISLFSACVFDMKHDSFFKFLCFADDIMRCNLSKILLYFGFFKVFYNYFSSFCDLM